MAFWAGNLPFWGTLLFRKPKIGRIGARRVVVGSACVDNRQSPSLTVLDVIIIVVIIVIIIIAIIRWFTESGDSNGDDNKWC